MFRNRKINSKWAKLARASLAKSSRDAFNKRMREVYADRRFMMVVCRNMMVAGKAQLKTDITRGAENVKTFVEPRGVLGIHEEHQDNVGLSLLFSKRLPNRAFTKVSRFLEPPHLKSVREMKKKYEELRDSVSQRNMDEAKGMYKKLKSLSYF